MLGYGGPKPGSALGAAFALDQRIRLTRTGLMSLSDGVVADIEWTAETYKNEITHSTVTDPENITVAVAGYYETLSTVFFTFDADAVAAGFVSGSATIRVNGATRAQSDFLFGPSTIGLTLAVALNDILLLAAGDVMTVRVGAAFAGGAASIITGQATRVAIHRMS